MKKETILFAIVALVIGVLVGVIFTNARKNDRNISSGQVASAPAVSPVQKITMLEGIVAKEPGNRNAWVQLGNEYFDSNQPMKAIDAYDKALAMNAKDPNVLTDQGIMFRRIGQFENAIKKFRQASAVDANHVQSLFNLGIVYYEDIKDYAKAKSAWERYLALSPSGPQADFARSSLDFISTQLPPGAK